MKTHKTTGVTAEQFADDLCELLAVDAISMWQILITGTEGFDLQGLELEIFTRNVIGRLLTSGAVPVHGSGTEPYFWITADNAGQPRNEIIDELMRNYQDIQARPDFDFIDFFELPWFSKKFRIKTI